MIRGLALAGLAYWTIAGDTRSFWWSWAIAAEVAIGLSYMLQALGAL